MRNTFVRWRSCSGWTARWRHRARGIDGGRVDELEALGQLAAHERGTAHVIDVGDRITAAEAMGDVDDGPLAVAEDQ